MADTTEQATEQQEQEQKSSEEIKYTDEGAKEIDEFLSDKVGKDYANQTAHEMRTGEREEKPEEEKKEEQPEKEKELEPEVKAKLDGILEKAEKNEDLSEEDLEFMKEQGYKVVEEGEEEEEPKPGEEKEEKQEESETPTLSLPESFENEIDDFLKDDDNYDAENATVEEKLNHATQAFQTIRNQLNTVTTAFNNNPDLATLLGQLVKGVDMETAITKTFGLELKEEAPEAGTPEYDQWVINKHKAKEARAKQQEFENTRKENMVKSSNRIQQFIVDNKLTDKKVQEKFTSTLDNYLISVAQGDVPQKMMEDLLKGMNYSEDIKSAASAAEVKGRNAKIKFKKVNQLGDGLPTVRTNKEEPKPKIKYADETAKGLDEMLNGVG